MKVFLIVCFGLIVLVFVINEILGQREKKRAEMYAKNISFLDSLRLTGFPIISFENNGKYINMILDTGSTKSIINKSTLEGLDYEELTDDEDSDGNVYGLNGEKQPGDLVMLPFSYKKDEYYIDCLSVDMTRTFSKLKEQFGVTVHGILGTDFFEKYKYILDFNEMVAYSIKKS